MGSSYTVEIEEKDGKRLSEIWRLNNLPHSPDGQPTYRKWDADTGMLKCESHFWRGNSHRDDGPSFQTWDGKTGKKTAEEWCRDGKKHREGGLPAYQKWDEETGVLVEEEYWINGREHRRDNLPAIIHREANGDLNYLAYFHLGKLTKSFVRELDGPIAEPITLSPVAP